MIVSKDFIRRDLYMVQNRERNFKNIRKLYDLSYKSEYTIDDQTFEDLNMNDVFTYVDRTYSTAGAEALYSMLRNPIVQEEKLLKRSKLIETFAKDQELSVKIRTILYKMNLDKKNRLINMIESLTNISKLKYIFYTLLGKIVPLLIIILGIVMKEPRFVVVLLVSLFLNVYINQKEESIINSTGLVQLRDLIETAKKLSKIRNKEME